MAKKELTAREEKFAVEWFKTGNQSEAYRKAYSTQNMAKRTIWTKASKVARRDHVRARFEELVKEFREKSVTDKAMIDMMLKQAFAVSKKTLNGSGMTGAANSLARLHVIDPVVQIQIHKLQKEMEDPSERDVPVTDVNVNIVSKRRANGSDG